MARHTAFAAICVGICAAGATLGGCDRPAETAAPADVFLANVAEYCGKAFSGRVVANEPPADADPFADKNLVMHVRGCEQPSRELRIPFHVGDDRSRTWILSRTDSGLRLKHDHRHEDGSEDKVTIYGGDTVDSGSATRQEFPVDRESVALFQREGLKASVENTWAMEIHPGNIFAYELTRPGGRKFRVEFDLTEATELPPPPWGHE
ncbi:hypothetical protein [Microbulbifer magnicolonia]|uniref:hypothetical protein n=1 Tax=Microbulbifer magnicolonia TaxID=3109744 RepID=UPI002B410E73|nr:hypothetical protein [Microbulbifer sp. GG15]